LCTKARTCIHKLYTMLRSWQEDPWVVGKIALEISHTLCSYYFPQPHLANINYSKEKVINQRYQLGGDVDKSKNSFPSADCSWRWTASFIIRSLTRVERRPARTWYEAQWTQEPSGHSGEKKNVSARNKHPTVKPGVSLYRMRSCYGILYKNIANASNIYVYMAFGLPAVTKEPPELGLTYCGM
jgi:hypothetical protein